MKAVLTQCYIKTRCVCVCVVGIDTVAHSN